MKRLPILILAAILLMPVAASAAGVQDQATQAQSRQVVREKPPVNQAFMAVIGTDVLPGENLIIGGYVEATVLMGSLGISLGGDAITVTIPRDATEMVIGAIGALSVRYYGKLNPFAGNYFATVLLGTGIGYGVVGFEEYSSFMNMYYVGISQIMPFYGEAGMQAIFGNRLIVQSLLRGGGALSMADGEIYPFFSVGISAGVFID